MEKFARTDAISGRNEEARHIRNARIVPACEKREKGNEDEQEGDARELSRGAGGRRGANGRVTAMRPRDGDSGGGRKGPVRQAVKARMEENRISE